MITIPIEWVIMFIPGLVIALMFFCVGHLVGVRRERKVWLKFIESQCRMSLTRTPEDPLSEMLKEREVARDRRLHRRDD